MKKLLARLFNRAKKQEIKPEITEWTDQNGVLHKKFVIPVNGMTKTQAQKELISLINDHKDNVDFDDNNGELTINGNKDLPFKKEIWFVTDNSSPVIETISEPEKFNVWSSNRGAPVTLTNLDGILFK